MMTDFKWYMISTISNKEDTAIELLKNRIKSEGLEQYFKEIKKFEITTISDKEYEKKLKGEKYVEKKENLYKGYIFINMQMNDAVWFIVRNTQYITGLIGSSGKGTKPTPVSEKQIRKMEEKQREKHVEYAKFGIINSPFKVGTVVEIIQGPFIGEIGKISSVDLVNASSAVQLEVLGRKTETLIENKNLKIISDKVNSN
nr:transcription termination/antitermination protein NusG [Mesomycoplasma hyorhinis]